MDPILRRGTSILYGARPRAVSLAGRPLPANPHERYPLVYAKVALADAVALRILRQKMPFTCSQLVVVPRALPAILP
jgi:hypothetical protein